MSIQKQIMVGMVGAGKSSFIAALYHVVESGEVTSSLQLSELSDDRKYLVEIRNKWLGCVEFDRTKLGKEQVLTLKLKEPLSQRIIDLVLPDVSGETFRDQWEHRRTTKVFDVLAQESDGMLLFIHPDTVTDSVRINKMKEVASVLDDEDDVEEEAATPISQKVDWHPSFAPTQVKLVEILQFLMREPHLYPIKRIAVIVSAWDIIKYEYDTPSAWISKRLPLLDQFLKTRRDAVNYKCFGISAQGGRLGEDNSVLLSKVCQSERIEVVTDEEGEFDIHDITAPIKWLMKDGE